MRNHRPRRALLAAAAVVAVAAWPGAARATITIGSDLAGEPNLGTNCPAGGTSCVWSQTALLGRTVSPQERGVVVRWRMRAFSTARAQVRLRVMHPGTGGTFTGAGTSAPVTLPDTVATSRDSTRLPIQAGDLIGVEGNFGQIDRAFNFPKLGALLSGWQPAPADGQSMAPTPPELFGFELLANADIEADSDGDGYGDETQDDCPTNGVAHDNCSDSNGGESASGNSSATTTTNTMTTVVQGQQGVKSAKRKSRRCKRVKKKKAKTKTRAAKKKKKKRSCAKKKKKKKKKRS